MKWLLVLLLIGCERVQPDDDSFTKEVEEALLTDWKERLPKKSRIIRIEKNKTLGGGWCWFKTLNNNRCYMMNIGTKYSGNIYSSLVDIPCRDVPEDGGKVVVIY